MSPNCFKGEEEGQTALVLKKRGREKMTFSERFCPATTGKEKVDIPNHNGKKATDEQL